MNTIVIRPKSKSNYDLILALLKKLGEKTNVISDKTFSEALFAAEIESSISEGLLNEDEKTDFLKDIKSKK
jgi:hypothetical protein